MHRNAFYTYNICGELTVMKSVDTENNTVAEYIYKRNQAGDI